MIGFILALAATQLGAAPDPEIARFAIERELAVEKLISHRFQLDDAPEAFRLFDERKTEKAVFVWDGATSGR